MFEDVLKMHAARKFQDTLMCSLHGINWYCCWKPEGVYVQQCQLEGKSENDLNASLIDRINSEELPAFEACIICAHVSYVNVNHRSPSSLRIINFGVERGGEVRVRALLKAKVERSEAQQQAERHCVCACMCV